MPPPPPPPPPPPTPPPVPAGGPPTVGTGVLPLGALEAGGVLLGLPPDFPVGVVDGAATNVEVVVEDSDVAVVEVVDPPRRRRRTPLPGML